MGTSLLGFEQVAEARHALDERLGPRGTPPQIGIVLGSGLGLLGNDLTDREAVPYKDIPHMPASRVVGHEGALLFGKLAETSVVCMSGRVHLYEGHHPTHVVFGVRLLTALGVKAVILTNAAGGIADRCSPGKLMMITDHLNLTGQSPLTGQNDERFGPRFVDLSLAYDEDLRRLTERTAERFGIPLAQGVYAGVLGPTYETPAEITMLERMGASAVGMSTVHETIALRHQGVRVLGISCITNHAAGKSSQPLSHDEVSATAQRASAAFRTLLTAVVAEI